MNKFTNYIKNNKQLVSIYLTAFFLLAGYLQHIYGINYVLKLTPLVIGIIAALVVLFWDIDHAVRLKVATIAIAVGTVTEIIGVNTGLLFGQYSYSSQLGIKIFGVPILIGIMWMLVTIGAWQIASLGGFGRWATVFLASWIVVIFDLLLEQYATAFGLWSWQGGVIPLLNYISWFGVSAAIFIGFSLLIKRNHISQYGIASLPLMMLFFGLMLIST